MFQSRFIPNALITTVVGVFASGCVASGATPPGSAAAPVVAGTQVIPTRYVADRFIATAVIPRGDTASFFLDTGVGSAIWDAYLPWFELKIDTIVNARGAKVAVAPFPAFRADASLPPAIAPSLQGTRLVVLPTDYRAQNNFVAWIGRTTQAQLGSNWFGDRVWTFDYPGKRLLLHSSPPPVPSGAHELSLYFQTDSAGRRASQTPLVDIVVEGDTLSMLFDTGATIWLTTDALARVGDGGPSERASTHIFNWVFAKWHAQHPDWPVIEHADLWEGLSLIRVPGVSIAGHKLGPTWFSVLAGQTTRPSVPANLPSWQSRRGGTVGGSVLRNFVVTVDYPRALAWFTKPGA